MDSANRRPIVLVPGACLGGWAWREVAARLRPQGHDVYPVPDRETLISDEFGSASGLREEHLQLIAQRATAHPYATMTSAVRITHDWPRDVRRAAIFCTAGGTDVASLRELIAQGDPRAAAFADSDWELYDLPTGHWAMLSLPGPLADVLHRIAES